MKLLLLNQAYCSTKATLKFYRINAQHHAFAAGTVTKPVALISHLVSFLNRLVHDAQVGVVALSVYLCRKFSNVVGFIRCFAVPC